MRRRTINNNADQEFDRLRVELRTFTRQRSADQLTELLKHGCYVYGAGAFGRRVAHLIRSNGYICRGFIDLRASRTYSAIDGFPIFHPRTITPSKAAGSCFVLGLHNHYIDVTSILDFARRLPFRALICNSDIPDLLGPTADNFWLTKRSFILSNLRHLQHVSRILNDRQSLDVFFAIIRFRIFGDYRFHPTVDLEHQYLPIDLPQFGRPIVFVDGGAFIGDTLTNLTSRGLHVSQCFAFEPDPENFAKLVTNTQKLGVPSSLFPCGLSEKTEEAIFEGSEGLSSHIATADNRKSAKRILCVALDDVIAGIHPDFIKLDIEGAELAALNGMRRVLAAGTTRLAVSGYHRPEDLWAVPTRLAELLPNSSIHLRQHGYNGFDSVFYAIPRGKTRRICN